MSVISKYLENGSRQASNPITGVCTVSSCISGVLLLKLYKKYKKSSKNFKVKRNVPSTNETTLSTPTELSGDVKKTKKLDKRFLFQLMKILKILIPGWRCSEVGYMGLISSLLVVRSLCDIWTIYLGTLLEAAIISGQQGVFNGHLLQFGMTMPLMSLTNGLLKYSTRQLELKFRSRLSRFLVEKYMHKLTFYQLNQSLRNVDQLITTDVEKFSSTVANLYSQLSKPLLDIVIYVYGISSAVGASVPGTMLGYLALSAVIIARLRRPMARLTAMEQDLEGDYRFAHARLITNSEEISFYKGGARELGWLLNSFTRLYNHLDSFAAFKFVIEFFENFLAKYIATIVGYYAVSRPFFTDGGQAINSGEAVVKERSMKYYKNGRMLVNLAQAIGRLVLNAKDLSRLAGYTSRVHNLMSTLSTLNRDEDRRLQNDSSNPAKSIVGLGHGIGIYHIQDHLIKFEQVPIVTPNGDVLLQSLNIEVKSGMNVLISGPNGCGKSSLFRILGELWPLRAGILTKPATDKLFYVPQKPYMPYGTFRDQVIYPDSVEQMYAKGRTDNDLVTYLKLVDLDSMVTDSQSQTDDDLVKSLDKSWEQVSAKGRLGGQIAQTMDQKKVEAVGKDDHETVGQRRDWDSVENWMDVLSGGQKQRLAMARLFYHRPQFAILDECTSAVSVDVEGTIYEYCRSEGITLFTVTHRKSLWAHHEYVLYMDGRGGYSFTPIDHSTTHLHFGS